MKTFSFATLSLLIMFWLPNSSLRAASYLISPTTADAESMQSAAPILARKFPSAEVSYLLLDFKTRKMVAARWEHPEQPIPIGSLVKPFTAIAYADAHASHYPEFTCTPGACWYPRGHGKIGIVRAVAFSCNAYFHQLATRVNAAQLATSSHRFGLIGPPATADAEVMTGERGEWKESPEVLVHAYAELISRKEQDGVRPLMDGMENSARAGTSVAIAREGLRSSVLAKTGTAPCTHVRRAPGDGLTVAAWPADSPHYILLVRLHGHPGAHAAEIAAKMIHALEP